MPVYKSKRPGVWRIVVWIEGRRRETTHEGSKADAERREATLRLAQERPGSQRVTPTLSEFSSAVYSAHAKLHLRESTWKKVRVYQVATLCEHLGSVRLTDLDPQAIGRFKERRIADGVKASSINNELRLLGTMLRFARAHGYEAAEPAWKKLPKQSDPRVKVWTAEQVGLLYATSQDKAPELLPLLVFLANTGCRKGEALACEWSWVDDKRDLLCIPSNDFWRPKNGLPREVPIGKALRPLLKAQRGRHERWVFPTSDGGRYAEFPKDMFWRARDAAGLTGGVHTLRHTFASHFLVSVPDMMLLGKVLGHSSERMTAIYSHLLPGRLDRARDAVTLVPAKRKRVQACGTAGTKLKNPAEK
jgi:integrase